MFFNIAPSLFLLWLTVKSGLDIGANKPIVGVSIGIVEVIVGLALASKGLFMGIGTTETGCNILATGDAVGLGDDFCCTSLGLFLSDESEKKVKQIQSRLILFLLLYVYILKYYLLL